MRVLIPTERAAGERRVAATPETVARLQKLGFEVAIEAGAGSEAGFDDAAFAAAGAELVGPDAWATADVVAKVCPPTSSEVAAMRPGATLISLIRPGENGGLVSELAARGVATLALDCVPRISRAQKMDVLSSMANIAGYRAVIEAATVYGRFFGGQITAAGKTPPARVLVIGAGVAGLAAIAAARGLGAEVRAFDVRAAAREQVKSLGAKFLEVSIDESGDGQGGYAKEMSPAFIEAEMALFRAQCAEVDIVITTALIPGRPAPKLILDDMLAVMRRGSVVVDLAAAAGGNCTQTVPGEVVERGGVTIVGYTDLTSRLPTHASQYFGTNVYHLLDELGGAAAFKIDMENDAIRGAVVTLDGEVTWPPPPMPAPTPAPAAAAPVARAASHGGHGGHGGAGARSGGRGVGVAVATGAAAIALLGLVTPPAFIAHFTVFLLAIFVGWQVVWAVTPALHTPLMSVTNAISGIILLGGMLQAGSASATSLAAGLGAVAVLFATINVAGGFLVTQRMLQMFRK